MKDIYLHLTYIKKCSACLYFRSNEYTNTRKTVEIITYRKGGGIGWKGQRLILDFSKYT